MLGAHHPEIAGIARTDSSGIAGRELRELPRESDSGGNLTDTTRRILYYRLSTVYHDERSLATLVDAFMEYEPVRVRAHG